MSYRKRHVKSKVNRIRPKKSVFKSRWFWFFILFLIIVLSALYFFMFYSGIQVKNIVISGNHKVATVDIESLIHDKINNKILGVGSWQVNSNSIFLVNTSELSSDLLNKFSIIQGVEVNRKFFHTLEVKVNERIPAASFCPSLDNKMETEKCYFMDDGGTIFESLSVMPQNMIIVRQVMNDSGVFIGEQVVGQNVIGLILRVEKSLKDNFQIDLKEALITSPTRLNLSTGENWYIYFNLGEDSDINSQLTKLNLLLDSQISEAGRKNLRYIDLRFKDKAIICDNSTCGR